MCPAPSGGVLGPVGAQTAIGVSFLGGEDWGLEGTEARDSAVPRGGCRSQSPEGP